MPRTRQSAKPHSGCNRSGWMRTDHACTGCTECPGRLLVDGAWWCRECAPKTCHRNCTHTSGIPGQPCPYCLEEVPCP